MRREYATAAALVLGYGGLAAFVPVWRAYFNQHPQASRADLISAAQAAAKVLDANAPITKFSISPDSKDESDGRRRVSVVFMRMIGYQPDIFQITLGADGTYISGKHIDTAGKSKARLDTAARRAVAEAALPKLTSHVPGLRGVLTAEEPASADEPDTGKFSWKSAAGERIELLVKGNTLDEFTVAENTPAENRPWRIVQKGMAICRGLLLFALSAAALIICFVGLFKKRVPWRMVLGIGFVAVLVALLLPEWREALGTGRSATRMSTLVFSSFVPALSAIWLAAAGCMIVAREERSHWREWDALFSGPLGCSRSIGRSVAMGIAWAAMPALLLQIAVIWPGLRDPLAWGGLPGAALLSGSPGMSALYGIFTHPVWPLFLFIVPAASVLKRRVVRDVWFFGLGAILFWKLSPLAAVVPLYLLWLYRRSGLLAVLVAGLASGLAAAAPVLTVSPGGAGGWIWAGLGIAMIASLALAAWGPAEHEAASDDEMQDSMLAALGSVRKELKGEFTLARTAQQKMLPTGTPEIAGFALAGTCLPAREVGGDLFDYLQLRDGRVGICVADVSGKGTSAALLMTLTKGVLTALVKETSDLTRMAARLNQHLYTVAKRKLFVTMVMGALEPETGEVEYFRAGHNPLVWRRVKTGETLLLKAPGMGLGCGKDVFFARTLKTERLQMEPGDALVFYSDGITEGMNESLDEFGEERLAEIVAEADGCSAEETRDRILAALDGFAAGEPPHDDRTLVVLRATL